MKLVNETFYNTALLKRVIAAVWKREQKSRPKLPALSVVGVGDAPVCSYSFEGARAVKVFSEATAAYVEAAEFSAKRRRYVQLTKCTLRFPAAIRLTKVAAVVRSMAWFADGVSHKQQPEDVKSFKLPQGYTTGNKEVDVLLALDVELASMQ